MSTGDFGSIVLERLCAARPDAIVETNEADGEATAVVDGERAVEVLGFLRDDVETRLELLLDVCAVDRAPGSPRFELVYELYSVSLDHRLRLKTRVGDRGSDVASARGLWPSAEGPERAVAARTGLRFVDASGGEECVPCDPPAAAATPGVPPATRGGP